MRVSLAAAALAHVGRAHADAGGHGGAGETEGAAAGA